MSTVAFSNVINISPFSIVGLSQHDRYMLLKSYYDNNTLYSDVEAMYKLYSPSAFTLEAMKPLRSPVNRSVEFYASKVASGVPLITANSPALQEAVTSFLTWSNFNSNKSVDIRKLSLLGNSFKKVVSTQDKVYQQMIDAEDVTSFSKDERDFLTEIRIDTTVVMNDRNMTRTEYWTLDNGGYMAVWVHGLGANAKLDELGDPVEFAFLAEFGIDFIPIVHTKFRDTGKLYGASCVEHCILKVDEVNRMSTRLHQTLFRYNKPLWAVSANAQDKDGRPLPPPKIKNSAGDVSTDLSREKNTDIFYLPGMSTIASLIPDIRYADALSILQAQEKELQQDLPELIYYALPERADTSGKALRTMLGAAVDRAIECENNFVQSQVRLNMMAVTVGQFMGIFPRELGLFDNGDLQHTMTFEEMFPLTPDEKAGTLSQLPVEIPLPVRMKMSGYSQLEINDATSTKIPVSS